MWISYGDRRPEGEISVTISTHGYRVDVKQNEVSRVHGESATIEFQPTDGGLDSGTIGLRRIE